MILVASVDDLRADNFRRREDDLFGRAAQLRGMAECVRGKQCLLGPRGRSSVGLTSIMMRRWNPMRQES
jgi:hypothetical protein